MSAVVADTQATVWYILGSNRLSPAASAAIEAATSAGDAVYVASISLVEILYLVEKGRLPSILLERLNERLDDPDSALTVVPLDRTIVAAMPDIARSSVPDMPDRIIAATASALGLPLVTSDTAIRASGIHAIW